MVAERWAARVYGAAQEGRPPFVEIVRAADLVGHGAQPEPFELLLGDAIRIRIPVRFDPASLLLLVNALDGR